MNGRRVARRTIVGALWLAVGVLFCLPAGAQAGLRGESRPYTGVTEIGARTALTTDVGIGATLNTPHHCDRGIGAACFDASARDVYLTTWIEDAGGVPVGGWVYLYKRDVTGQLREEVAREFCSHIQMPIENVVRVVVRPSAVSAQHPACFLHTPTAGIVRLELVSS